MIRKHPIDISGMKFNKLTILKLVGKDKRSNQLWECKCDCGNIVTKIKQSIVSRNDKKLRMFKKRIL